MEDQLGLFNVIDGHPMAVAHDPAGELSPGDRVTEVLTVMPEYRGIRPPARGPIATGSVVNTPWGVTGTVQAVEGELAVVRLRYPQRPVRKFTIGSLSHAGC